MNPRAFQGTALRIEFGAFQTLNADVPPRNVVALFVGANNGEPDASLPVRGELTSERAIQIREAFTTLLLLCLDVRREDAVVLQPGPGGAPS